MKTRVYAAPAVNGLKWNISKIYINLNVKIPVIFSRLKQWIALARLNPANRHLADVGLMLGQRRRRWPNIKSALGRSATCWPSSAYTPGTWDSSNVCSMLAHRLWRWHNIMLLHLFIKHETLTQCWFNVGPYIVCDVGQTSNQLWNDVSY